MFDWYIKGLNIDFSLKSTLFRGRELSCTPSKCQKFEQQLTNFQEAKAIVSFAEYCESSPQALPQCYLLRHSVIQLHLPRRQYC